jgi:hypothetical protein
MATFSTNQFRHLYVAKSVKNDYDTHLTFSKLENAGDIAVVADKNKSHVYFQYMSPGGLTRSDLISIDNIEYLKYVPASKMNKKLKAFLVTLDPTVNTGNPIAGEDYILRIAFSNYVGISEEDQYFKYGMVHAYAGMDASTFYKKLAISLAKNFSRESEELLKFYLGGTEVTPNTKESDLESVTATSVVIVEQEQPWVRGKKSQVSLNFQVYPTTVTYSGDEVVWGKVENISEGLGTTVGNGKTIADMEYFYMGERGDIYRDMGAPNTYDTQYLVDPNEEYDVLEIHYSYTGSNESVQKSEKDITIVGSDSEIIHLIEVFSTITGTTVKDKPLGPA